LLSTTHDAVDPETERAFDIVDGHHTFEHELSWPVVAKPCDIVPGEAGVHMRSQIARTVERIAAIGWQELVNVPKARQTRGQEHAEQPAQVQQDVELGAK
jgi:hypothetical protein